MQKFRDILTSDPVLPMFDPKKPTTIQADVFSTGIGACLLQDSRPIAYASRYLADTESRYSQIEKELLAIVFAVINFHYYINGRDVVTESGHKPLEAIIKKPIHSATPGMQLTLLRPLRYNLQVQYVPGSHMYIADAQSRAHVTGEPDESKLMLTIEFTESRRSCPPQMSASKSYVMLERKMQPYRNFITSRTMSGHQRSCQYPWMYSHIGMYGTLSMKNNHYSLNVNVL